MAGDWATCKPLLLAREERLVVCLGAPQGHVVKAPSSSPPLSPSSPPLSSSSTPPLSSAPPPLLLQKSIHVDAYVLVERMHFFSGGGEEEERGGEEEEERTRIHTYA